MKPKYFAHSLTSPKTNKPARRSFRRGCLLAAGALAIVGSQYTQATVVTWDGGGGDNNWITTGNWTPAGVPTVPGSGLDDIHFAGSTRLTPSMQADYNINSLTFDSGAGAFVLGGANTLTLQGGGIVNNDNSLQTINISNIILGAAQSWNTASTGGLTVSSAVDNDGNLLTVNSNAAIILSGAISDSGGLTKNGASTLTLSGSANTYSGLTTVNEGTLTLSKTADITSIAGNLTIGDGIGTDTVTLTNSNQIANTSAVTINAGGVLGLGSRSDAIGSLTITAGSVTGTGTLTLGSNVIGNAHASTAATISSLLNLGGVTRTFTIADGAVDSDMTISGIISNGGLTKEGAG